MQNGLKNIQGIPNASQLEKIGLDKNKLASLGIGKDKGLDLDQLMIDKEKINKKQAILSSKSIMEHILDIISNGLLSILGFYLYLPTFVLNIPNSNLETLIPEKDGCKLLFNDETTCKTKIKCF